MAIRAVKCKKCIFKIRFGREEPCNKCTEIMPYKKEFTDHFIDEGDAVSVRKEAKTGDSNIRNE